MKKPASYLALTVALLLILGLAGVNAEGPSQPQEADILGPVIFSELSSSYVVNIFSPENSGVYANPLVLVFSVEANVFLDQYGDIGYSVDNGEIRRVTDFTNKTVEQRDGGLWYWSPVKVNASVPLPVLAEGNHNVTVYYGGQSEGTPKNPSLQRYTVTAHSTVNFTVLNDDADAPSNVQSATQLEPFPVLTAIAVSSVVALSVIASLLFYFKRIRH